MRSATEAEVRARSRGARPQAGTRGAIPPFQSFLDDTARDVYRFLLATVGPGEVDDCFQETYLAALRAYPRLRHAENLRGWILAVATRKSIDAARARARRPVPIEELPEVVEVEELPLSGEVEGWLWEAMRSLSARQRTAVVHRVLLDRPYPELADALGCSVETARAHVYQGLRRLREVWRRHDEP